MILFFFVVFFLLDNVFSLWETRFFKGKQKTGILAEQQNDTYLFFPIIQPLSERMKSVTQNTYFSDYYWTARPND